ncbi:HAD family hydrolase [Teredinibacter turnerae]|uniref:HAD family hydrolase n=1 Tax=Teredinibacter turnerae TaxID=2426 RepID=UPI0003726634|nr:HAD family phosphatase [Teredinibacter turnerae]
MHAISTILFDLGGVLLELDGLPIKDSWVDNPIPAEQNWLAWLQSPTVKGFETGQISEEEFVLGVVKEFNLKIDEQMFREAFINWPKSLFPGAAGLLEQLKPHYKLAFFSNTNRLHLPRLLHDLNLASYFNHTYASYEIGLFKPDVESFVYVANDMQVAPEHILFIDDNQVNIDGAIAAGMHGKRAVGLDDVRAVLAEFGLL